MSSIPPSSLPLGNKLTDAYLALALGPAWKEFVVLWNEYFPQIEHSVQNGRWHSPAALKEYTIADVDDNTAWHRPRMEYIIGELDKLDKYFNNVDFQKKENRELFWRGSSLHALKKLAEVEPCLYHFRLADLSRMGSVLVTANYDDGIEKALGADAGSIMLCHGTKAIPNGSGGYVYHFHGIATDDPNQLGATIKNVSDGLDEDFQNYLKKCFETGYDIVFIGYSGTDFFDVAPFFRSLEKETYPGKAIFYKHCAKEEDIKKKMKGDDSFLYLLAPFENQYIAYADTNEFFEAIYNEYTPITTPMGDCGAFEDLKDELNDIVDHLPDKDTYYFLNMFRLCSQLNINPGRFYPDWVERICNIFSMWRDDGMETLKKMTVTETQKNDGIIDDIYSNNWGDERIEKTGMRDVLRPHIFGWEKKHRTVMSVFNRCFIGFGFPLPRYVIKKYVDRTVDILNTKKADEKSADISRSTVMYLCGRQTKLALYLYRISHGLIKRRMLFLREQIKKLLSFPFTRFRYRTHYLSLCRQLAYMDCTLSNGKNGYQGDIQAEWDICMQTPNLFDAGQVLNCRLVQAKWYGLDEGVTELKEIREMILDLRKEKTGLKPFEE